MKKNFSIFLYRHWDALLASAVACIFIYLFTRVSGIGISPDSVNYESAANNILHHFSFTDFNGKPLVDFPLGYPSFLAFVSFLTGASVLQAAPAVNCILISGVIILTSIIIDGFRPASRLYKIAILSLVACSPCLLEIYAMLWSETLFLVLTLLFIVLLKNYSDTLKPTSLFLTGLVAALAFVTRYAGVTLLITGIFMIAFNGAIPLAKKLKHVFLFSATGVSLVLINLLRNKQAAGQATGIREKALRDVGDSLEQAGSVLSEWFPFLKEHLAAASWIFVFILLTGIGMLIYRMLQQQYFTFTETIVTCYFVVYAVFIIIVASISRFEDLSGRLLSPLYIPMLLTATGWIVGYTKKLIRVKRTMIAIVCLIVLAAFHIHHYKTNAEAWEGIKDSGMPGYAEGSWRESAAVAMLRKNKARLVQPVYANSNDAAYFMAGIHAMPLPHKEIQQEIDELLHYPSFTVVWFVDGDNPDLVSLDFIRQRRKLVSSIEVENGGIYVFGGDKQ